jgi:flavin reductase (DIM6/NTAB) family NADH-FMN oxidoreductase RutF/ubiquinone/menaquinone biosynthesis C-methylase UbiE
MSFDPAEFRKVLGHFATGVTVVTTAHAGEAHAMTVNSFCSVSLEPPLVLFCADKRARTHSVVQSSGVFAVNILREAQRPISDLFAGKGTDAERKAVLSSLRTTVTGSPVLEGALGWIDCRVSAAHDAGDHVIYVGAVVATSRGEMGAPLLYYRGSYQALDEAWRWSDRYAARDRATRFDEMVDFFDRLESEGPYAELLRALAALGAPAKDARCLDIGCGTGRLVRDLSARCREAVGVDASAPMLARASRRAKVEGIENASFQEAWAEALPFEGGAFDLVTASNLLTTLAEPVAALKEAARVLRPFGRLALLEPTPELNHAGVTAFLTKHEHTPFTARALLSWSGAVEVHRSYDEAKMVADLRAAGFAPLSQARQLDGLALLSLAERS